ncbi:unnamed protein product [Pleuronectes platessa]|uniref:Uncharacterized protein n=1 Tax=Pleuronectes platessa TaxID=8262 RepID=A0A9N7UVJ2_PLEPL|nr:unnamed protein product [Pleuronectes platessa]
MQPARWGHQIWRGTGYQDLPSLPPVLSPTNGHLSQSHDGRPSHSPTAVQNKALCRQHLALINAVINVRKAAVVSPPVTCIAYWRPSFARLHPTALSLTVVDSRAGEAGALARLGALGRGFSLPVSYLPAAAGGAHRNTEQGRNRDTEAERGRRVIDSKCRPSTDSPGR